MFFRIEMFEREVEYWKIKKILDIFKSIVDSGLIDKDKQIKQYRNWLAYHNPKNGVSVKITPRIAYGILLEMIQEIQNSEGNLELR